MSITNTASLTGKEVLDVFGQSLMTGTEDWKNVVADDISFKGPVDQVEGKEAFIQLNLGFFPMVKGVEMLRRTEENGLVCSEMIYKIQTPTEEVLTCNMVELAQITDGKIQSMTIYYDAEEFRKAFSN